MNQDIEHILKARIQGYLLSNEPHGIEAPGYVSAAGDTARESALLLSILALLLSAFSISLDSSFKIIIIFGFGLLLWKTGRSAWLGWFRLERLHRVLEQERWEIEHHRPQEKEELRILYIAKGFEGKLLEDVVEVLMADNDRLLRVMVEEELCLPLASIEHPLKQALGAASGVLISLITCLIASIIWPFYGIFAGSFIVIASSALYTARLAQNNTISAIVWNVGIAVLTIASIYFLLQLYHFL